MLKFVEQLQVGKSFILHFIVYDKNIMLHLSCTICCYRVYSLIFMNMEMKASYLLPSNKINPVFSGMLSKSVVKIFRIFFRNINADVSKTSTMYMFTRKKILSFSHCRLCIILISSIFFY